MSRSPVRYRNQMIFRSFIDFYDAMLAYDGVTAIRTGGMSSVGSHETTFKIKTYNPTRREIKVDAHSSDGFQEIYVKIDPSKALSVKEYIEHYKAK